MPLEPPVVYQVLHGAVYAVRDTIVYLDVHSPRHTCGFTPRGPVAESVCNLCSWGAYPAKTPQLRPSKDAGLAVE